jgi:elongation factor P--(R)-beta-lysine ligase
VPTRPWWHSDVHADRRPFLLARGRIVAALRRFFSDQGFLEVEPSILQLSPGNETHLHAFATELTAPDGARTPMFLHTSPEFACKKLLAAGERKIFALVPAFRNRERGALHHPAFTMLEWYRVGAPYEALMQDCAELLAVAARAAGSPRLRFGQRCADPLAAPLRLSVADAFARHAGIDLLATLGDAPDRRGLAAAARASGVRVADDDAWGDIFSRVLVERIEGALGNGRATLLVDYPAKLAALARPQRADPRLAERFELYACGVELVNGFGELNDPGEQRRRLLAEMAEKERIYGERYPIDEDFLAALAEMPPASGAALGVDRLVMLASGAAHIEQVIWTPLPHTER